MEKRGRGKPRKPDHLKLKVQIHPRLSGRTWEQLRYLADQEEMYVAEYIRMVLKRHIKEVME